jgi:hypothetical protein
MSTPEPLLTSGEVKRKIATLIGGKGIYTFRKWTRSNPPVLPRYTLPEHKQPRFRLSDVNAACSALQSLSTPKS